MADARRRQESGLGKIEATRVLRLSPLVVRNRPEVFSPKSDLENTPVFEAGTASTLGLAANALLNDHQTVSASYLAHGSRQTGVNTGLLIPYVPRNYLQLVLRYAYRF